MKASMSLNGEVRSRDIQQFLNTYSAGQGKTIFLYCKNEQIFLTTDASEASKSPHSRKELLANLKNSLNKSAYGNEVQSLLRDIRNLAKTLPTKGEKNIFEDQNHFLSLTTGQLTFLIKHRNDPSAINSQTSRTSTIDKSIKSIKNSLEKYATASEKSSGDDWEKIQNDGKIIGKNLAEKMIRNFQKQKMFSSPHEKDMFAILFFTDDIKTIKGYIQHYCHTELSGNLEDYQLDAITTGLQESLSNIQPKSIQNHNMQGGITAFLADTLKLNNETYQLVTSNYAGMGGHGFVHMYRNQSKPQELIAIKSPVKCYSPEDIASSNEVSQSELTMHLQAMGTGHENVVEVKGAFMVEGRMCIALEDCSFGALDTFAAKKLVSNQDITDDEMGLVLLTLGRDILRGLNFLHTESRIIHGDFKPQNIFMGVDGKAKIGDFDRSVIGTNIKRDVDFVADTAQYTSPSLLEQKAQYRKKIVELNEKYNGHLRKIRDERSELQSKQMVEGGNQKYDEAIKKKSAEANQLERERSSELKKIDKLIDFFQSDDTYAAGVTLYELCFGSNPFITSNALGDVATTAEAYGKLSAEQRADFLFSEKNLPPALQRHTSDLRKLISELMDPDLATRLPAGDALKSPVFADNAIGSDAIRQIIMKVGQTARS